MIVMVVEAGRVLIAIFLEVGSAIFVKVKANAVNATEHLLANRAMERVIVRPVRIVMESVLHVMATDILRSKRLL